MPGAMSSNGVAARRMRTRSMQTSAAGTAVKINLAKFFTWTGAILIVVAAGVLAYGFHDLQEAGILPGLDNKAFDVSGTISADSWLGTLLKGTFNFQPDPTWLQVGAWLAYLVPTLTIFLRRVRTDVDDAPRPTHQIVPLLLRGHGDLPEHVPQARLGATRREHVPAERIERRLAQRLEPFAERLHRRRARDLG